MSLTTSPFLTSCHWSLLGKLQWQQHSCCVIPYNPLMQRLGNTPIAIRIFAILVVLAIAIWSLFAYSSNQLLSQAQEAAAADNPSAAHLFAKAAQGFPPRPDLWDDAGMQALLHEDYAAAIEYFERAQQERQIGADGWVALGTAHQLTGDNQKAIQIWEEAIAFDNANVEAYRLLAVNYRQNGDYPAAIEALNQLTLLQPGNAAARFELGLLLASSNPEEAITNFEITADLDDSFQEDSDILRRALRDALASDDPAYAAVITGQALASVSEWRLAAENFVLAIEYDLEYAEAWAYLGEAKQRLGQGGFEELQTALLLNPDSLSANIFQALYWQRLNQPEQALVYLTKATELNPENPDLFVDLGRLTAQAGDLPIALEHYKQAIQLAPSTSRYWVALAEFTVDFEVFIEDEGLPAARQALELAPEDPAVLVANGRVAYLMEDHINAIRFYDQAIILAPEYAATYIHLGLLHLTQGNRTEAESAFLRALEIDLDGLVGQQAQRLLEQYFP